MNNIDKILQYLVPFAKEEIQIDDTIIKYPITSIVLSDHFFEIDSCNMCGHCCPPEHNVYTQFECDEIMSYDLKNLEEYGLPSRYIEELRANLIKTVHNVNGRYVNLYTFAKPFPKMFLPRKGENGKEVPRCYWVYKREDDHIVCGIHPVRSITCRMPHMRVFHNKKSGRVSITNSQFGRNWALGCLVKFSNPSTVEQFEAVKAGRLEKLKYLNRIAEDVNVRTYLPEVIAYVERITFDKYQTYLNKNILEKKSKKLFKIDSVDRNGGVL